MQTSKLYKGKYFIVFYDSEDMWLKYMFNNVGDILEFMNKPKTNYNKDLVLVEMYRALRSKTHMTRFLTGEVLRVYIINAS